MTALTSTSIHPPKDEQAFERASAVLLSCMLDDPNVQLHGRRGQNQSGVDITGIRNGDPSHHVGVQCKCKSLGKQVTIPELEIEINKALTFQPRLKEFHLFTTAPTDANLQKFARIMGDTLSKKGIKLPIIVWGWDQLEEKISEYPKAMKAFDPSYTPQAERTVDLASQNLEVSLEIKEGFDQLMANLQVNSPPSPPSDSDYDAEIERHKKFMADGKLSVAIELFREMWDRVKSSASARILFRIKANIGYCTISLGDKNEGIKLIEEAISLAPTDPRAVIVKLKLLADQEKWDEAAGFASDTLKQDPENATVASLLVQTYLFVNSDRDPFENVPNELLESEEVRISYGIYLRAQTDKPEAHQYIEKLASDFPNNQFVQRMYAESVCDQVVTSEDFKYYQAPPPSSLAAMRKAAKTLKEMWDEFNKTEVVGDRTAISLCFNTSLTLHVLGQTEASLVVVKQGLERFGDEKDLIMRAVAVALDEHDKALMSELLPKAEKIDELASSLIRFYAETDDWKGLIGFAELQKSNIPEIDNRLTEALLAVGKFQLLSAKKRSIEAYEKILDQFNDDARALITIAQIASKLGYESQEKRAYESALGICKNDNQLPAISMTASYAFQRKDYKKVILLLNGRISTEMDSRELRLLAFSFAVELPITQAAQKFFTALPEEIRELPYFKECKGLMLYNNRDLATAESIFREVIHASPTLNNYLPLLHILKRDSRNSEGRELVESIPDDVAGSPVQKSVFAQYLMHHGFTERALEMGYMLLRLNPTNAEVALKYAGLLSPLVCREPLPVVSKIGPDAWFRIDNGRGRVIERTIEDNPDLQGNDTISQKDDLAINLSGLSAGETVTFSVGTGTNTEWTVTDVQHKYVHAYNDTLRTYEVRFPNHEGIHLLETEGDDITPILDNIRETSQRQEEVIDLHSEKAVPLTVMSKLLGLSTIEVPSLIKSRGKTVRACLGTHAERKTALDSILTHKSAVLDAYSAWIFEELDSFDILDQMFNKIYLSNSSMDEIYGLLNEPRMSPLKSMHITWKDGEFFKTEYSTEDRQNDRLTIENMANHISEECHLRSVFSPDHPPQEISWLLENGESTSADAINLAIETQSVLISEDLGLRSIAQSAYQNLATTWIQAIFMCAKAQKIINQDRYAELIVQLAKHNHRFLSSTAIDYFTVFNNSTNDDFESFRVLARNIGGRNTDLRSHLNVVIEFVNLLWNDFSVPNYKEKKAVSLLLENLIKGYETNWPIVIAAVIHMTASSFAEFIALHWIPGHFLPKEPVEMAYKELSKPT